MECVPVQRCNDTLLSIVGQLDEESKQVLLARAQQVFEEAQRMRGGVVQYGGTRRHFTEEFCNQVVSKFQELSLYGISRLLCVSPFATTSAICDVLMKSDDAVPTVDYCRLAEECFVSLSDLQDFTISLVESDGDVSVVDLFLEHVWSPEQILVFCVLVRVCAIRPELLTDLEARWHTLEYKKNGKPRLREVLDEAEESLRDIWPTLSSNDPSLPQSHVESMDQLSDMAAMLSIKSKTDFVTVKEEMIQEMDNFNLKDEQLDEVPGLDLVGDEVYENMDTFKKMTEYQLCDHLALDYDKKMNVNRHDKLLMELNSRFLEGRLHSWVHAEDGDEVTHVKVLAGVRSRKVVTVEAAKVAFGVPMKAMCNAGTRVLAKYNRNRGRSAAVATHWDWGTLGTFPIKEHRFQYLVFFDSGEVRFVRPKNLYLCIIQPKDPRKDEFNPVFAYKTVRGVRSAFLRDYFARYPNWPLMNINVESSEACLLVNRDLGSKKKRAVKAAVLQKDRCLLFVRFLLEEDEFSDCRQSPCEEHVHEDEWIFAGDTLRIPTLKNILSKVRGNSGLEDYPEKLRPFIEMLYPKYEVSAAAAADQEEGGIISLERFKLQNTARKTGAKREPAFFDFFNNARHHQLRFREQQQAASSGRRMPEDLLVPEWLEPPDWSQLSRRAHPACGPDCLREVRAVHRLARVKDVPPCFRPLLYGFSRDVVGYLHVDAARAEEEGAGPEFLVVYEAPCGRRLRSLDEVAFYLHVTHCDAVTVDQFSFRAWHRPNFIYRSDERALVLKDYSGCREAVSIPVVNSVDYDEAPAMLYQCRRAMDEPLLDTQMEFVSCCSCTDDCLDAERCECQQLTRETHQRLDPRIRGDVPDGYVHRRLQRKLFTGIYECNMQCGCRRSCVNRVVQRDMSIPMQLFKTEAKGWGVRTLVDLQQGQFVCTYSGKMFTDIKADEHVRNGQGSDMYFADVDLFDSVEGMKRGFHIVATDDEGVDMGERRAGRKKKKGGRKPKLPAGKQRRPEFTEERTLLHYIFGESRLFVVDAQERGNLGRFFNHSCDPNMEVQMVFVDTHDIRLPVIAFFTSCDVQAGTELCWNYGYVAGSVPGKEIECSCGSAICVGRIL